MWKVLILLAAVVVGGSAGRYELKGQKRVKLERTLDRACQDYGDQSQIDQVKILVMQASLCLYNNFDHAMSRKISQSNGTDEQQFLDTIKAVCDVRLRLRECAQQVLEYLAPCASAPVQAKIGDMKAAITELFNYFCNDDMAKPRYLIDDGGFACLEKNTQQFNNCTKNMVDIVTELPEDTNSFEAIEMCHKYDTMASCMLDTLNTCPKPTAKEFVQDVLTLVRSGTYCRVTVPVEPTGNAV